MRFWFSTAVIAIAILLDSCNSSPKDEALARKHCGSCHAFPSPALLDKSTWRNGVLPEMRFRMGLEPNKMWDIDDHDLKAVLTSIPSRPLVTEEEWKAISNYFLTRAPDSLPGVHPSPDDSLSQFEATAVHLPIGNNMEISMLRYSAPDNTLFIGTRSGKLYTANSNFQLTDSLTLDSPASQLLFSENEDPFVLTMGNMDPNDQMKGKVSQINLQSKQVKISFDSLKRPVYLSEADLSNDNTKDLLVACFGNYTGELLTLEKKNDTYVPHVVHNFPGTRKAIVRDVNKDGFQDIIALITQGNEQITAFLNYGDFRFKQRNLLKFSPVHGSSYFEMVDINNDGFEDIVMCNGDNADYSSILKPYHGVRVFLNDRDYNFEESFFFQMHGASQTVTADFDNDGDMDIAAISYFPDFVHSAKRSFVYLENNGKGFSAHTTSMALLGRWITMEKGDIDDDGDLDLILGALNFAREVPEKVFNRWTQNNTSILILKNRSTP